MDIVREKVRTDKLKKSQTCRFCLAQNVPLTSIYAAQDQNISTPLPLQIMSCVGIEVYREDGMPGLICADCRLLMNYSYQFKQMCNDANSQLKAYLSTGVWPNQLSLPKGLANLLSNLQQPPTKTDDKPKVTNIIKLSPADLKNFKQGQKLNNANRTAGGEEANTSSAVPLMTSTPIVKRQGSGLVRSSSTTATTTNTTTTTATAESNKPLQLGQQLIKVKKEVTQPEQGGASNEPVILNNLVQSTVPKVAEEFVSTGDGTVEMVVTYAPEPSTKADGGGTVFPCNECPRTYPLKQLLDIHQLSHKRERKHQCDHCDKRFFSKYDLAKHIATHTGERPYVCVICRASFSRSSLLVRHQAKHQDEPKHLCKLCERSFLTVEDLQKHIENHEKSRPYHCAHCPKSFAYKQGLERHEIVHLGKLPFQCEYCEQSFLTAGKLSRHLATHAGDRPYPCRLCNKSFLLSHHLSRHLRRHNATGQSEYKCSDCGELFNSLGDLVYHSAKHAMESLTCPLCLEPFDSVEAVTEHIRSHADQQQYACDYCDLMYTSEQKLADHCLQHHANELAYELPDDKSGPAKDSEQRQDANGVEPNNFVMDYRNVEEEEIFHEGLFLDEDESTLVPDPLSGFDEFDVTEIEVRPQSPPEKSAKSVGRPPKATSATGTKTAVTKGVTKVKPTSTNTTTDSKNSSTEEKKAPTTAAQQPQEDGKASRQQRMEEFFKRNQEAVEKRMANQKLSDVLKSLPKGVTVKMETVDKQSAQPESVKNTATDQPAAEAPAVPQKRGPGRPPKVRPVEAKEQEASKTAAPSTKRSVLPAKVEQKTAADGKRELKRSATAIGISRERTKPVVAGQENSKTATKPPPPAPSKSSDSQSWMIKRTYAAKSSAPSEAAAVGKKRPAEENDNEEAEESAPSKRPALGRKTLNPSMVRQMSKKEPASGTGKQPVRASTVLNSLPTATTVSATTTTNNIVNVKNLPKPTEAMKKVPVEMNIGGRTIKLHKITREEAIARANQLKAKQ
ncbi:zinc finger protein pita [Anopheles gambiae]|uniref:zinc finger protein pita n=1 Tax=Anopheles gambiae TaxID=7165 RepID=UPI002AC93331|nr:zinc finger protein pita [Anopheles gambiae]